MSTGGMQQKQQQKQAQPAPQRVVSPKVTAGICEKCSTETTKVYKTNGRVRHCKCNTCGHTWKLTGPFADELREYSLQFADSLKSAGREDIQGEKVILIPAHLADELEKTFRRLATT